MNIIRLLLVLITALVAVPVQAATVEEMHRTEKLMTETDTVTGDTYLLAKIKSILMLFRCEDEINNLCRVSGGAVRITTFSAVTSATSSSITSAVPTGRKTFVAQIINATSETKAATLTILGNWTSSTTGAFVVCIITLPSTATVLQLQDACPPTDANFPFWFYTASVYTSASSAPLTVYAHY